MQQNNSNTNNSTKECATLVTLDNQRQLTIWLSSLFIQSHIRVAHWLSSLVGQCHSRVAQKKNNVYTL